MSSLNGIAITSGSIAEQLSQRLMRLISDGELSPGERLPSERELAESAGVSRTTVREALRDLELRGLVTRTRGRGTVVQELNRPDLQAEMLGTMESAQRVLGEVMDLRAVIEPPIAERAAQRNKSGELAGLLRSLEQAEAEIRRPEPSIELMVRLDVEFHTEVAKLTHNPMLERLLDVSNEWMAPSRQSALQTKQRLARSIAAHRKIYDAISRHDVDAARGAMSEHIQEVSENIGIADWDS